MQYMLVRIFPYLPNNQAPELELLLRDGWQLHGSPFAMRPDEAFQAVIRHGHKSTIREGQPGRISTDE